jgi:TolB protein
VLHRVRPDGTGDTALTADSLAVIHPTWSSDSRQILFCTDDDLHPPAKGTSEIYALDVASGRLRALIAGGTNTYPSLSPDGGRIVFRRMVGATISAVFIARADGSDSRDLTPQAGWDGWPEWSPDGTRIAFASNRGADPRNWQVYVMNPDGGAARLVARTEGRATVPHWSRDGAWIYFSNCDSAGGCAVLRAEMRSGVR